MTPKPLVKDRRLPVKGRKAMTVAIGMYCLGGVFVCADSHVISTDGIVTSGYKLNGTLAGAGSFVIANASDDGNAANMVAKEILDAITRNGDPWQIERPIKKAMTDWHSGYAQATRPSMQFVLACHLGNQTRRLYFCEPPNTVVQKSLNEWVVIGVGGQTLDTLIPEVIRGPLYPREALIRTAYLMYRAKSAHAFLKGSETDVLFIAEKTGRIVQLTRDEMSEAEKLGPDVDFMLRFCYLGLLGQPKGLDLKGANFLKSFKKKYVESRKKADAIEFPSLENDDLLRGI